MEAVFSWGRLFLISASSVSNFRRSCVHQLSFERSAPWWKQSARRLVVSSIRVCSCSSDSASRHSRTTLRPRGVAVCVDSWKGFVLGRGCLGCTAPCCERPALGSLRAGTAGGAMGRTGCWTLGSRSGAGCVGFWDGCPRRCPASSCEQCFFRL